MSPRLIFTSLTVFLFACQVVAQQDVSNLIEKLNHRRFAVRKQAAEDLVQANEKAVEPVLQILVDSNRTKDIKRTCFQILLELSSKKNNKTDEALRKYLPNFHPDKYSHVAAELRELRYEVLDEVAMNEKQALALLEERGCDIFPFNFCKDCIYINATKFSGKKKEFRNIVAIKKPIYLLLLTNKQYSLFDVMPKLNLVAIQLNESFDYDRTAVDEGLLSKVNEALVELFVCSKLRVLSLQSVMIKPKTLESIGDLTNLERVTLPMSATDRTLSHLSKLKKLREIALYNCAQIKGVGLKEFKNNNSIKSIDLFSCGFEAKNLRYLHNLKNLNKIRMPQHCNNDDVENLTQLQKLSHLELDNTLVNDNVYDTLNKMTSLRRLTISGSPVTDRFALKLKKLKALKIFNCQSTFITRQGFESIKLKADFKPDHFFEPNSDSQNKLIGELIKKNVPIKLGYDRKSISLYLDERSSCDLSKLDQLELVNEVYLFRVPSPENLDVILNLAPRVKVFAIHPGISEITMKALKGHFTKVVDSRNQR